MKKNIKIARKSIVASKKILKGEVFTAKNLLVKRPFTGISPMNWYKVLGKKQKKILMKTKLLKYKKIIFLQLIGQILIIRVILF